MTEAATAARTGREFSHLDDLGLRHRRDHQLRNAIAGPYSDRRLSKIYK
jgi:hypothetical protein